MIPPSSLPAQCLGNIGNVNFRLGNLKETHKYYQKADKIFEQLQDIGGILRTKFNIANVLYQMKDYKNAKEYYNESIDLADNYQEEDFDGAIELYKKVNESSLKREDFFLAGTAKYYSGLAFLKKNNKEDALQACNEAVILWEKLDDIPQQMNELKKILQTLEE